MVRTGLGSDTPTMLMETLGVWLSTQVPWRTGAIPALQGSSLPFAEELIHRRPDRDSRACGVHTLLPELVWVRHMVLQVRERCSGCRAVADPPLQFTRQTQLWVHQSEFASLLCLCGG